MKYLILYNKIWHNLFFKATSVRLAGGKGPFEGRVEVYHNQQWGSICDDRFDEMDAKVICKMLGYKHR